MLPAMRERLDALHTRLSVAGGIKNANENIAEHLDPGDLELIEDAVCWAMNDVLDALMIASVDPNTENTARRVAKMMVREVFAGRFEPQPETTDFPNARDLDTIYTVGPIAIRSTCSHHFCPILGDAWVGIIPSERVIGLSKFSRLARWVMARPQIQEEATVQLADVIEKAIAPRGLALIVKASHTCMTWRGVLEHDTTMTTSVMRGLFRENDAARMELMKLIEGQRFACR